MCENIPATMGFGKHLKLFLEHLNRDRFICIGEK